MGNFIYHLPYLYIIYRTTSKTIPGWGLPTDLAWYLPDNASSCGGSWQDACTVGPLRVAQPCTTISYQASLFAH